MRKAKIPKNYEVLNFSTSFDFRMKDEANKKVKAKSSKED